MGNLNLKIFIFFLLLLLIIGFLTSCVSHSVVHQLNPHQNPNNKKLYPSVAMVTSTPGTKGKASSLASAWAIDNNHLITAGHFCNTVTDLWKLEKAGPTVYVVLSDEKGLNTIAGEATIVAFNTYPDVCILYFPWHPLLPLEVETNYSIVETEDPITIVGAPDGFFPIRKDGYIYQVDTQLYLSVQAQSGNSGCPVIRDGKVVGMLVAVIVSLHESGIAERGDTVLNYFNTNRTIH